MPLEAAVDKQFASGIRIHTTHASEIWGFYQRVGRLSMQGCRRRAIYAILKQKPYNFPTAFYFFFFFLVVYNNTTILVLCTCNNTDKTKPTMFFQYTVGPVLIARI